MGGAVLGRMEGVVLGGMGGVVLVRGGGVVVDCGGGRGRKGVGEREAEGVEGGGGGKVGVQRGGGEGGKEMKIREVKMREVKMGGTVDNLRRLEVKTEERVTGLGQLRWVWVQVDKNGKGERNLKVMHVLLFYPKLALTNPCHLHRP